MCLEELRTEMGENIEVVIRRIGMGNGINRILVTWVDLKVASYVEYNGNIDLSWKDAFRIMDSYYNNYGGERIYCE